MLSAPELTQGWIYTNTCFNFLAVLGAVIIGQPVMSAIIADGGVTLTMLGDAFNSNRLTHGS